MQEVGGVEEGVGEWEEGEESEKGSSQSHGWLGGDYDGINVTLSLGFCEFRGRKKKIKSLVC